ncbi:MAG: hypothetical protein ACYDBH_24725 [Acidobacteriaceae bacterium]
MKEQKLNEHYVTCTACGHKERIGEAQERALHKLSFSGMTFDILRAANKERLPLFKNAKGGLAHSEPEVNRTAPTGRPHNGCKQSSGSLGSTRIFARSLSAVI